MKVVGLDGRTRSWNLSGCEVDLDRPCSRLHKRARDLLRKVFSSDRILEEVPLPGTRLKFDFVLPTRRLVIEVQGVQHFQFVPHFHGSRLNFLEAQKRDRTKAKWCTLNRLGLVSLPHDESDEQWEGRIRSGGGQTD